MTVNALYSRMLELCGGFMSPINAQGVLQRAFRAAGVAPKDVTPAQVNAVVHAMRNALKLFLNEAQSTQLLAALQALAGNQPNPPDILVPLKTEADLVPCRQAARDVSAALALGPFAAQKLATLVSELARNVVKYTPGGSLTLRADLASRKVLIVSDDQGSGIPNLDEVLSGRYRSKTGLGLGLLGTRRLAQRFDVKTGPNGTHIEAEVAFDTNH